MLQFSQFVWALSYSVWDVFNNFLLIDATDRSKIGSDQKRFFIALSLYPLSFFANTPFKKPDGGVGGRRGRRVTKKGRVEIAGSLYQISHMFTPNANYLSHEYLSIIENK